MQSSGRLIGLTTGEILEKNIDSIKESYIANNLAKKVLQIFYVSTDARVTLPLAYFPTIGLSGEQAFNFIFECIQCLEKANGIININIIYIFS